MSNASYDPAAHSPESNKAVVRATRTFGDLRGTVVVTALLFLAVAIRINYVVPALISGIRLPGDAVARYQPLARNLAAGNGFTSDDAPPYRPNDFDQPGYPAFVATIYWLTSGSEKAVLIAQLILELLTLLVVFRICKSLNLTRRVRRIAVGVGLMCPFLTSNGTRLMTEVLATFVVTLTCWALLTAIKPSGKATAAFGVGLASGACLLIRPDLVIAIVLMNIAAVAYLFREGSWKRPISLFGTVTATVVLVLTPWTLRGYLLSGSFRPLGGATQHIALGYSMWLSTWILRPSDMRDYWWRESNLPKQVPKDKITDPDEWNRAQQAYEIAQRTGTLEGEASQAYASLASEAKHKRPIKTFVILPLGRLILTWAEMPFQGVGVPQKKPIILFNVMFWWSLTGASLAGLLRVFFRREWTMLVPFALLLGRLGLPLMSYLAVFGYVHTFALEPRYFLEALPACFIFAGLGAERGAHLLKRALTSTRERPSLNSTTQVQPPLPKMACYHQWKRRPCSLMPQARETRY